MEDNKHIKVDGRCVPSCPKCKEEFQESEKEYFNYLKNIAKNNMKIINNIIKSKKDNKKCSH